MYRLTVHLANAPRVDTMAPQSSKPKKTKSAVEIAMEKPKANPKKEAGRVKTLNTMSFYCDTKELCMQKLNEVREKYTIAKGTNPNKPHKFDKELWYISFVN